MSLVDQYGRPLTAVDRSFNPGAQRVARLRNTTTGMGSNLDKTIGSQFDPIRIEREEAETVYQMSWTMARLVNIIVDDMFAAGMRWTGDDQAANDAMDQAMDELKLWKELPHAIKASRIFGTAGIVICTDNIEEFHKDLAPEDVKEGSLRNLVTVDRFALSILNWRTDKTEPRYSEPYQYQWNDRTSGYAGPNSYTNANRQVILPSGTSQNQHTIINSDRFVRFDGQAPPLTEGWISGPWERKWGVSLITRALDDIMLDATMTANAGHLVAEASIWVQKIQGFKEAIATGRPVKGEASVDQIAEESTMLRSIYRTLFMDAEDEAERKDVAWGGLIDIVNNQTHRIAAIGGIPYTRFMGSSATGLSATGDGDARDWRIEVEATRKRMVDPVIKKLFLMIARHVGLSEPPEWEWLKLGELSQLEEAQVLKTQTEAVNATYLNGLIDEDEGRQEIKEEEHFQRNLEMKEKQAQQANKNQPPPSEKGANNK